MWRSIDVVSILPIEYISSILNNGENIWYDDKQYFIDINSLYAWVIAYIYHDIIVPLPYFHVWNIFFAKSYCALFFRRRSLDTLYANKILTRRSYKTSRNVLESQGVNAL